MRRKMAHKQNKTKTTALESNTALGDNLPQKKRRLSKNYFDGDFLELSFPSKLWRIVESDSLRCAKWDRSGVYMLINEERFTKEVLQRKKPPQIFQWNTWGDFTHQLELCGIQKVSSTSVTRKTSIYYHPYFRSGVNEIENVNEYRIHKSQARVCTVSPAKGRPKTKEAETVETETVQLNQTGTTGATTQCGGATASPQSGPITTVDRKHSDPTEDDAVDDTANLNGAATHDNVGSVNMDPVVERDQTERTTAVVGVLTSSGDVPAPSSSGPVSAPVAWVASQGAEPATTEDGAAVHSSDEENSDISVTHCSPSISDVDLRPSPDVVFLPSPGHGPRVHPGLPPPDRGLSPGPSPMSGPSLTPASPGPSPRPAFTFDPRPLTPKPTCYAYPCQNLPGSRPFPPNPVRYYTFNPGAANRTPSPYAFPNPGHRVYHYLYPRPNPYGQPHLSPSPSPGPGPTFFPRPTQADPESPLPLVATQAPAHGPPMAHSDAEVFSRLERLCAAYVEVQANFQARVQLLAQAQAQEEAYAQALGQAQAQAQLKAEAHARAQVEIQAQAAAHARAQVEIQAQAQSDEQARTSSWRVTHLPMVPVRNMTPAPPSGYVGFPTQQQSHDREAPEGPNQS